MGNHTAVRGRGRSSGSGGTASSAAAKLEAARQRVADAEAAVRRSEALSSMEQRIAIGIGARGDLRRAQESLARLEGRQLGPGEARFTREEYLAGKASAFDRNGRQRIVSPEEARAYLANPTPRGASREATTRAASSGPTPREREAEARAKAAESRATAAERRAAQLERQLATLQAQHDALKARVEGGAKPGGRAAGKAPGGWSERNQAALNGPNPEPRNGHWDTYSPSAKSDPYRRVEQYGKDQLRAVLVRTTQTRLREAAKIVMERNPGTKPTSLSSNESMVNYIMEQVAPGY